MSMTSLRKFTIKIYLYKFFDRFMLIYPLYAVMFADYKIDPIQIAYLFMAWKVTSFLLEFPSGVTADLYSRRNQLILSEFMILIGYLIWAFSPNFVGFLIGFILWGAKSAFTSGTFEAFVYDELKVLGKEDRYAKVYGRMSSVAMLAMGIAALLSVLAFKTGGYQLVLVVCAVSNGLSALSLFSIKEAPITRSTGEQKILKLAKHGIKQVLNKKDLLIIVIFTSLLASISTPVEEYMNLLVVDSGLAVTLLGVFSATLSLMYMIGNFLAEKFEKSSEFVHYSFVVISGLMLFIAALFMNKVTIILLVIEAVVMPIVDVNFESKSQSLISSEVRATVSSIKGFLSKLGSIVIIFIVGLITQFYSYRESYIFLSLSSLFVGVAFMIYSYTRDNRKRKYK